MAFKIGDHLSQSDLDAIGQERQDPGPGFSIFHEKTAELITFTHPFDKRMAKLGEICIIIHEGMRVLTSNRFEFQGNKLHSPFGMFYDLQVAALNRFKLFLENLEFKLKPKPGSQRKTSETWKTLPFQRGALIAISALIMLYRDLHANYNVPFILADWLTQVTVLSISNQFSF